MMTADEARTTIAAITAHLNDTRALLLDLKEREGWRALGYDSWRACAQAEFGQSQSRVYQLLDAAKVDRALSTVVESPTEIPEAHARILAPVLRHAGPAVIAKVYAYALGDRRPSALTAEMLTETVGRYQEAGAISIPHRDPAPVRQPLPTPAAEDNAAPSRTCRSCHAPIAWVKTVTGRDMPVNPGTLSIVDK